MHDIFLNYIYLGEGPEPKAEWGAVKKLEPGPTRWQYAEVVEAARLVMVFFGLWKQV